MTDEQARQIEQNHNVYVDAEAEMYTTGERVDTYGWAPIPKEWTEEVS